VPHSDLPDYYEILEVSSKARSAVVDAAWRRLSQEYHPDLHPDDPTALARSKLINEAHDVLKDPEKRRAYDAKRQATEAARTSQRDQGPPTAPPRRSTPAAGAAPAEPVQRQWTPPPPPSNQSDRPASGGQGPAASRPPAARRRRATPLIAALGCFGLVACVLAAALATGILPLRGGGPGTFIQTGSMSTDRYYATATLLANGKVLIAGGYDNGTNPVSSAELYEPSSSTFSPTGSMSTARDAATATLLANGKVLIAGGGDNAAELYGPASGTFSPTGSMSTDRYYATATLLANGKVLIAGGYDNDFNPVYSAELYDPASGTFSPTGSMSPRDDATATLLANGKVLIAGGYYNDITNNRDPSSSAELYDPASGTFSPTGSMSTARYGATATLLANGKVLIAGGYNGNNGTNSVSSAELYDPASGTFSPTGSMSTPRDDATATLLANGKVLIAGGYYNIYPGYNPVSSAELYDPASGTFSPTGSMSKARDDATATLLANGKVLIAGGGDVSAELYSP